MKRIKTIFPHVCLLCVLGLGAYGLNAMRGDESDNFYLSGAGKVFAVGSSALVGAGMGVMVGLIAGWIVGSSALATSARRGMMVGLIAGLIFGAYNTYKVEEPNYNQPLGMNDGLIDSNGKNNILIKGA